MSEIIVVEWMDGWVLRYLLVTPVTKVIATLSSITYKNEEEEQNCSIPIGIVVKLNVSMIAVH